MSEQPRELRPAYRTLNDSTRLLGLSIGAWLAVIVAAGLGYGGVLVSPLGWRANVSLAVIGLGTPLALAVLRESSTISPGRLLAAVVMWRLRAPRITGFDQAAAVVRAGAVRLDHAAPRGEHLERLQAREEA